MSTANSPDTKHYNNIASLLRRLDSVSLRSVVGETILKAIELSFPSNVGTEQVEVLKLKYGDGILAEKQIRLAILDTLTLQEAQTFCKAVALPAPNHAAACVNLQEYFDGWSEKRSREYVSFFDLSPNYQHNPLLDTRTSKQLVSAQRGATVQLKGILHKYQQRVKDEIASKSENIGSRFLCQMPTGSGKTYTALESVVDMFRKPEQPGKKTFAVWLVSSNELAEQAFQEFQTLWQLKGDREIALYRLFNHFSSDFTLEQSGVVFASFDKLHPALTNNDHSSHKSIRHLVTQSSRLIVDEAHTSVAPTHNTCIQAFINPDQCVVIGLTATPGRTIQTETLQLTRLYSTTIIEITDHDNQHLVDPIQYLQDNQYLAELKITELQTNVSAAGSPDNVCKVLASNPERNKTIIAQIQLASINQEPTLVFACTLDHVFALKILCASANIDCRVITGATPQVQRNTILEAFRHQDFFILLNLDLLATGVDLPNLQKLIITRPVGSPILYSQILGRALRGPLNGGRSQNTVLTLRDNLGNYPSENLVYTYFGQEWNRRTN